MLYSHLTKFESIFLRDVVTRSDIYSCKTPRRIRRILIPPEQDLHMKNDEIKRRYPTYHPDVDNFPTNAQICKIRLDIIFYFSRIQRELKLVEIVPDFHQYPRAFDFHSIRVPQARFLKTVAQLLFVTQIRSL